MAFDVRLDVVRECLCVNSAFDIPEIQVLRQPRQAIEMAQARSACERKAR